MSCGNYQELPSVCKIYDDFINACNDQTMSDAQGNLSRKHQDYAIERLTHDREDQVSLVAQCSVSFSDNVEIANYEVDHDMCETYTDERDYNYEHSEWRRSLDPKKCEAQAVSRARKWAKYVYKTIGNMSTAVSAVKAAAQLCYYTPAEWLSDTGSPET
jgi:hypothetical protein